MFSLKGPRGYKQFIVNNLPSDLEVNSGFSIAFHIKILYRVPPD